MLSIKLDVKPSIFDKIICYEKVDVYTLDKLIYSNLLKEVNTNPFNIYETEKNQLIKYKNIINNNIAEVKYNRPSFGRTIPEHSLGLFLIRKEIRHSIAKEFFIDIDIVNCHAQILYQICKYNKQYMINIKFNLLEDYVLNRNKYLNIINEQYNVNNEISKKLFIRERIFIFMLYLDLT